MPALALPLRGLRPPLIAEQLDAVAAASHPKPQYAVAGLKRNRRSLLLRRPTNVGRVSNGYPGPSNRVQQLLLRIFNTAYTQIAISRIRQFGAPCIYCSATGASDLLLATSARRPARNIEAATISVN